MSKKIPTKIKGEPRGKYCYIKFTESSSRRLGPCEVCGEYASDVWLRRMGPSAYAFGHRSCIEKKAKYVLEAAKKFKAIYYNENVEK